MPRRPRISDEERALFRDAVADVSPLPDTPIPVRKRPRPRARLREKDERDVLAELAAAIPDGELETGDEVAWRVEGVQDSILRKLRRGQFRVQRVLDLHGFNVAEAKVALAGFLQDARRDDALCVRIIHGKGRGSAGGEPVLKRHVGGWLRRHGGVLAYTSPRATDGGTGAVIVLLRRL